MPNKVNPVERAGYYKRILNQPSSVYFKPSTTNPTQLTNPLPSGLSTKPVLLNEVAHSTAFVDAVNSFFKVFSYNPFYVVFQYLIPAAPA